MHEHGADEIAAALNDNPENPVFIETVPRKGLALYPPVEIAKVGAPGSDDGDPD